MICPLTEKDCDMECAWHDPEYRRCSVAVIAGRLDALSSGCEIQVLEDINDDLKYIGEKISSL